jgi:hypothetical protein
VVVACFKPRLQDSECIEAIWKAPAGIRILGRKAYGPNIDGQKTQRGSPIPGRKLFGGHIPSVIQKPGQKSHRANTR